jgi:hypothetical protein
MGRDHALPVLVHTVRFAVDFWGYEHLRTAVDAGGGWRRYVVSQKQSRTTVKLRIAYISD